MLPETHPLFDAEAMLLTWFEKAPPNYWVEFYAIASNNMKRTGLPNSQCDVCPVSKLETSFDLTMASWIQARNAEGYHVHAGVCPRATVNRTAGGHPTHAKKENILLAVGAWVDIDKPHWRTILESEKPKTTFVVSTGNGCHLYFKYQEPKEVVAAVEDCKSLMTRYGGDHCFDEPRVLRIPGTINWKTADGTLKASIYSADIEQCFEGVPGLNLPGTPKSTVGPAGTVNFESIFGRVEADVRNVALGGPATAAQFWPHIDIKEDGAPDRSNVDYVVMKKLSVAGVSDAEIAAVFHNPDYGISEKTLEEQKKQGNDHYFDITLRKATAAATAEKNRTGKLGPVANFKDPIELSKASKLQFAVERILPIGGFCVLSGASKAGKSLAATDLMLLMAGVEGKFFGELAVNHTGPVGYAQAEITEPSLKFRLETIGASRNVKWENYPIHVLTGRFNLMSFSDCDSIVKGLQRIKAKYFVLDPLARFHLGNENNHKDMMDVLSGVERIAQECDLLGTLLIHHHGKPGEHEKFGVQQMRGSTVIADWGNAHVLLAKRWTQSTGRKFITVSFELRDAEELDPLSLALDGDTLRHTPFNEADAKQAMALGILRRSDGDRERAKNELVRKGIKMAEAERLIKQASTRQTFEGKEGGNGNGHVAIAEPPPVVTVEMPDHEPQAYNVDESEPEVE